MDVFYDPNRHPQRPILLALKYVLWNNRYGSRQHLNGVLDFDFHCLLCEKSNKFQLIHKTKTKKKTYQLQY